jgi:hypothetical protein
MEKAKNVSAGNVGDSSPRRKLLRRLQHRHFV